MSHVDSVSAWRHHGSQIRPAVCQGSGKTRYVAFAERSIIIMSPSLIPYHNKLCFFLIGLDADGIYRVSGNLATIQKLRFLVDQGNLFRLVFFIIRVPLQASFWQRQIFPLYFALSDILHKDIFSTNERHNVSKLSRSKLTGSSCSGGTKEHRHHD